MIINSAVPADHRGNTGNTANTAIPRGMMLVIRVIFSFSFLYIVNAFLHDSFSSFFLLLFHLFFFFCRRHSEPWIGLYSVSQFSFSLSLSLSLSSSSFLFSLNFSLSHFKFSIPILYRQPRCWHSPPWPSVSSAVEGAPVSPNTSTFGECNSLLHSTIPTHSLTII